MRFERNTGRIVFLFSLTGIFVFVILYVLAAFRYPGGSYADPLHNGFSFWNNYLCDLLDTYTIGGQLNAARIYARLALLILCVSLIILWFHLPKLFPFKNNNQLLMRISGIAALVVILFLAAGNHDVVVRIAGVFGFIAFISAFIELYRAKFYFLLILGIFCLVIFFINYYIYETGIYIGMLPVIQKVTFVSFICWFLMLNIALYQRLKSKTGNNVIEGQNHSGG
jgi:hypothetical protein